MFLFTSYECVFSLIIGRDNFAHVLLTLNVVCGLSVIFCSVLQRLQAEHLLVLQKNDVTCFFPLILLIT